ncbi:MAG: Hsp20/alpha crystallin family protein [Candidatus Methanomethylicia archaeon]
MCNDEKVEKEIKMVIGGLETPIIKMFKFKHEGEQERFHIKDEGEKYIITVETPGVKKEDIKIYLNEDTISITAKPSIKLPRRIEEYKYKIKLEEPIEVESAKAKYFEGILTMELLKKRIGRELKVE